MIATLIIIILLVIAAIVLALLISLYLVPVRVEVVTECMRERISGVAAVVWGPFKARVRVADDLGALEVLFFGRPVMTRDLEEVIAASLDEEREEEAPSLSASDYIDATIDLWPHLREIMAATVRSLHLEVLRGEVTLGLESPAATGEIYGYCTALRHVLWPAESIDFVMNPVFDDEIFEGSFTLDVQIRRPLLIIIPVVSALLQKPVRQRIRQISGRGVLGA